MDRPGHENITYFTGIEIERTCVYGMRTLFVIGPQDPKEVLSTALKEECPHVYLGANHTFRPTDNWQILIESLVTENVFVTLDFDVAHIEWVIATGAPTYNNFIPMVSVKTPYLGSLGYNATLKLDDKDFEASNPGVWCHNVHELMSRKTFTAWSQYGNDDIVG